MWQSDGRCHLLYVDNRSVTVQFCSACTSAVISDLRLLISTIHQCALFECCVMEGSGVFVERGPEWGRLVTVCVVGERIKFVPVD